MTEQEIIDLKVKKFKEHVEKHQLSPLETISAGMMLCRNRDHPLFYTDEQCLECMVDFTKDLAKWA